MRTSHNMCETLMKLKFCNAVEHLDNVICNAVDTHYYFNDRLGVQILIKICKTT